MSASHDDPILIVTGPPGVGKTTTAEILAGRSTRAVHLEADAFFRFIRSGYVEPWKPESHRQNQHVMQVVAAAAAGYVAAGYFTIVDGIVMPDWFLEPLRDAFHDAGHRVACAVLRAPLAVCTARAQSREGEPLVDPEVVRQLWQGFVDLGDLERNALDWTAGARWKQPTCLPSSWRTGSSRFDRYLTVSVPSMPASRWPGTLQ